MDIDNHKWRETWAAKAEALGGGALTLETLLAIDGFDSRTGTVATESWQALVDYILAALALPAGAKILEVGCGAGALLLPIHARGYQVAGVDYSAPSIAIVRRVLPGSDAQVCEAHALPFADLTFDGACSNSVFQYFANLTYATSVLDEMRRVAKGPRLVITDVPDLATRDACERFRREGLSEAELALRYRGRAHLYYPRAFFETYAREHALEVTIAPQAIPGYCNNAFRYNVSYG